MKIITWIRKIFKNEMLRYLVAGGLTTGVNVVSFFLLRKVCHVPLQASNFIAIMAAILFAYVINHGFVFQSKKETLLEYLMEMCKFIGARLFTMLVEIGGVYIMVVASHINEMVSKIAIQFVILILNFVISKYFVFAKEKTINNEETVYSIKKG